MGQITKRLAAAAAGAWLSLPGSANAQPRAATLDDVLAMSTFGAASFSPDGRWLAVETLGAYDSAPRFDLGVRSGWATTQLQAVEVSTGALKPLIPAEPGWGYLLGPWSPTGARLVVYRLGAARFEAGIVDMASRSVVWTGLAPDWPSSGQGAVWLDDDRLAVTVRTDGALPLRLRFDATGEAVIRARWATSRQGRAPSRLALDTRDGGVVADEPVAPKRLMLLSAPFTHAQALLDGAIRDIETSPDGRTLAVLRMGEVAPQPPAAPVGQSAILNRTRLSFVDTASGRITTPDPDADIAPHLLRWSPDSRRLLVWRRLAGDRWRDGRLSAVGPGGDTLVFDTRGLDPAAADADLDELRPARADWLGDRPLLYARKGARWDWWLTAAEEARPLTRDLASPPGRLAALSDQGLLLFADHRLWAVDGAGRAIAVDRDTDLAPAEQADALTTLRLRLNAPPRRDWAAALHGEELVVLDQGGRRLWSAPAPCAGWRKTVAVTGQAIAFICGEQGVETLWLARPDGVRAVTRMNPGFADLALAVPRPIDYRDARGGPVRSWLFLPPGVRRAEIEAVIVLVYPGALDDGRLVDGLTLHMGLRPQLLAMGRYAVLSAAVPSVDALSGDDVLGGITEAVDRAVDALFAREPDLAAAPLAVAGHSFGGFAALGVATRSSRFAAYVAWAAPTDPASRWGEPPVGTWSWPTERLSFTQAAGAVETGQLALGAPPWAAPEVYANASVISAADRIDAPVLLLTADRDYVPSTQAQRLFAALRRQGKPARLVTYWGEGHDNASPANIRDAYAQIFDFLAESFRTERPTNRAAPPTP